MKQAILLLTLLSLAGCATTGRTPVLKEKFSYQPSELKGFSFAFPAREKPLIVAVIDTGVTLGNSDSLKNRIQYFDKKGNYGWDNIKNQYSPVDISPVQHGTLVSQIIAEHLDFLNVPDVKLMPVRYTTGGDTSYLALSKGIDFAIRHGANIINISTSGDHAYEMEKNLLEEAGRRGILVVVSAGNEGESTKDKFPCAYKLKNVICVGNGTIKGRRPSSNFGPEVAVMIDGRVKDVRNSWTTEGTSFSAPQITAALAFWWRKNPTATIETLRKRIETSQNAEKTFSWTKFVGADRSLANIQK